MTLHAAVIGGAVAGLAAADRLSCVADHVDLFERMEYGEERTVNCGEAITSPSLIPLDKTPGNGFVQEAPRFTIQIWPRDKYGFDNELRGEVELDCTPAYVTDRQIVETAWARDLAGVKCVTVHEGETVSTARLDAMCEEYDVIVDASGNPGWAAKALGFSREYTGDLIAVNGDIEGDFSKWHPEPHVIHEGGEGYFWIFPKSESRANVGAGWNRGATPDDYHADVVESCEFHGAATPDQGDLNVYTIPEGPALHTKHAHKRHAGTDIYLVGDAVGTANRYQGEGISQAIRSSYLLADLIGEGRGEEYPRELYEMLRDEYRLATLMRGLWDEFEDPDLLYAATKAIEGLTLEQVTREPYTVLRRMLRHPRVSARLALNAGMRDRALSAWRDKWEFGTPV